MAETSGGPGGRVFVSYRRGDASYPAAWLFDQLTARFGSDRVFMDVDSIEPGDDFAEVIADAVGSCAVLLAVIGDRWLVAADDNGRRRLDDPGDFVRLEIEAALARGVRVIPVLVDGARVPRPDQLPASLATLARRQAAELSHSRSSSDLTSLLNVLDRALAPVAPPDRQQLPSSTRPAAKAETAPRDTVSALPASITCFQDDDTGSSAGAKLIPAVTSSTPNVNPGPPTSCFTALAARTSQAARSTGPGTTSSSATRPDKPGDMGS